MISSAAPGASPITLPAMRMFLLRWKLVSMLNSLPAAPGQRARQVPSAAWPAAGAGPTGAEEKLPAKVSAAFASVWKGNTRDTYSRRPPLPKKARAA
jgi:hypothetical protein